MLTGQRTGKIRPFVFLGFLSEHCGYFFSRPILSKKKLVIQLLKKKNLHMCGFEFGKFACKVLGPCDVNF